MYGVSNMDVIFKWRTESCLTSLFEVNVIEPNFENKNQILQLLNFLFIFASFPGCCLALSEQEKGMVGDI